MRTSVTVFATPIASAVMEGIQGAAATSSLTASTAQNLPVSLPAIEPGLANLGLLTIGTEQNVSQPISSEAILGRAGTASVPADATAFDADFEARATASANVLYATNFDDVYLDGALDATRSGIASKADMLDEAFENAPQPDNIDWSTTTRLSGAGSCRLITLGSDGSSSQGSWAFRPDGRTSTTRTRLYVQFSVYYPKETIGYRFNHDGDSYFKTINCGQYGSGQVVVGDATFSGFPVILINGSSTLGNEKYFLSGGDTPWGVATTRESPGIDNGASLTGASTKEAWLNNYGVMPRGVAQQDGDYGYDSGDPYLYERSGMTYGWPDSRSQASGAVPWQRDGWTTVEVFLEYNGDGNVSTIQMWVAPYGESPVLMVNEVETIDFNTPGSNSWSRFDLLNYATGRQSEAGRPTQNTFYDEIVVSTAPIKFPNPGGSPYIIPGHQDLTALETLAADLSAGEHADYAAGTGQTNRDNDDGFDWQSDCHYHEGTKRLYYGLKAANARQSWEAWEFDTITATFTDIGAISGGLSSVDELGHIYGNSAMDPDTGDLYFQVWGESFLRIFTQSSRTWSTSATASPDFAVSAPISGLGFHPDFYGAGDGAVIVLGRDAVPPYVHAWRKSNNTWDRFDRTSGGTSTSMGMHNPFDGYNYLGARGGEALHRVSNSSDLSVRAVPPINIAGYGGGEQHGTMIPHPDGSGDILLVENQNSSGAGNRVWKSSDGGLNWSSQSTHPFDAIGSGPHFYMRDFGVVGRITYTGLRIWKPA